MCIRDSVDSLVLVDTNEKLLNTVGDKFLLEERLTDFNAMLEDTTIEAVHLVTPPATHAPLSIQVMNAGKHCACTIPMGMSIDELYQVIDARKRSGKHLSLIHILRARRKRSAAVRNLWS